MPTMGNRADFTKNPGLFPFLFTIPIVVFNPPRATTKDGFLASDRRDIALDTTEQILVVGNTVHVRTGSKNKSSPNQ